MAKLFSEKAQAADDAMAEIERIINAYNNFDQEYNAQPNPELAVVCDIEKAVRKWQRA